MPLFRHQRRSTQLSETATPTAHDHGVNVEPIAIHKLRALLHRTSRKSMRLDNDDVRRSVQLSLDDANSNQRRTVANLTVPASMKYRHSRSSTGTGSEDTDNDTGHRPKDQHSDFAPVTHKTLSPPESASITPPSGDVHLPADDKEVAATAPLPLHSPVADAPPIPGAAPPAVPVTPASALGLSSIAQPHTPQTPTTTAPSPSQIRTASVHPANTRCSPPRPVPAIETTTESPSDSGFHTPHTHNRSSHESAAVEFITPEGQRPSVSSSQAAPSPSRAPVPFPQQRRRSSAVSTTSAHSVGSPRRMAAVLQSPPMPMPIAHLPTLQRAQSATVTTPGWGHLAIEGGPRSPALSRTSSRASASNGFPFFAPPAQAEPHNSNKEMTDAEVRRATKAMPVMFRVPSRQPAPEEEDDGGEAEDDEDDDDFDDEETSSAAPLPSGPPAARSAFANQAPMGTMDAVSEESRSVTPVSVSSPSSSPRTTTRLRPTYFERPMSLRDASATPSTQDTGLDDDNSSLNDSLGSMDDTGSGSVAMTTIATPASPSTPPRAPVRPAMYQQVSQSMINLPTPVAARTESRRPSSPTALETTHEQPSPQPDSAWANMPPPTPWNLVAPPVRKRRLSAGDADGPPPPQYETVSLFGNTRPAPRPREEEGRERLPPYWCGVHIEGTLSRKMEFNQPGVQAKDRGWKKFYFVLHGTALFVYKFDPSRVPLRQNEPYLTCSEGESLQHLHVHLAPDHHRAAVVSQNAVAATAVSNARAAAANPSSSTGRSTPSGRRNTVGLESAIQRNPIIANAIQHARRGTVGSHTPSRRELNNNDNGDAKNPALFEPAAKRRSSAGGDSVASSTASAPIASHMPFAHNQLLHVYGLTGAESGLAADYKKRLHCVRVRAEGQQFMLQTETARQCVQWIEAFQAATNVAQDLDTRPMPVQQTLPRRRRRAARRAAAAQPPADPNAPPTSDNANNAGFADTPEGNIAAVVAAERAERERMDNERDRMLAEDQAAESQARFRT